MRARPISLLFGITSLLASCVGGDDGYDDARTRGDLGAGNFKYGCLNESDLTCDEAGRLPKAIAVGGRFDLAFEIKSGPQPLVIAPANDFVRSIEGGFQVRAAGLFALLAVNGNREVVDIKHLRGAEIEEIRVQEDGSDLPSTTLTLDRRQSLRVLAVPYGIRGVQLGGALSYSWTSADDTLVSVSSSAFNRVQLRAGNKSGKTELQIDVGGKTFSVAVEVGPDEAALDAGTAGDAAIADARSDAGDGSGDAASDAQGEGGTP